MNNNHFGISTKGAVLALVLFAFAIGLTGYLYRQSTQDVQEVTAQSPMLENIAIEEEIPEPSSVPPQASTAPTATVPPQMAAPAIAEQPVIAPTEQAPAVQQTFRTVSPVPGEEIGEYAMDALSYNETTRDWRVHNGIDLAAEDGSPVCAAADGTVYTTYEDDTLGFTVVLRHAGGYTTRYSSLRDDLCVQPGDTVTMGQTIGYAGDTALVENVMGSHVHFSVSCQDEPMNPADFFALG